MIKEIKTLQWIHFFNSEAKNNKEKIKEQKKRELNGTIGKYLIFSDDFEELTKFSIDNIKELNLSHAKVTLIFKDDRKKGDGYASCIYDYKKRKNIEEKIKSNLNDKLSYYGWKPDRLTLKYKYPELTEITKK